jgi:phosphatidylinositol alpha-mannosyltransferase
VVAGYDWPVVAQRVLEVYNSAIEATSNAPTVRGDDPTLSQRLAAVLRDSEAGALSADGEPVTDDWDGGRRGPRRRLRRATTRQR